MSSYSNHSFCDTLRAFLCGDGLPFDDVLSEDYLQERARHHGLDFAPGPDAVYTPAVTLWLWLAQCLSATKSCGSVAD